MAFPLRRLLAWILVLPLAVVLTLFAIANRGDVVISVDPLPFTFGLPIYVVVFAALAIGLIAGYLVMWISGYRTRRDFRRARRNLAQVESELHAIRAEHSTPAEHASVPTVERNRAANDATAMRQR